LKSDILAQVKFFEDSLTNKTENETEMPERHRLIRFLQEVFTHAVVPGLGVSDLPNGMTLEAFRNKWEDAQALAAQLLAVEGALPRSMNRFPSTCYDCEGLTPIQCNTRRLSHTQKESEPAAVNPRPVGSEFDGQVVATIEDCRKDARVLKELFTGARSRLCSEFFNKKNRFDLLLHEGIVVEGFKGSSLYAFIKGPDGTPYENAVYRVHIDYTNEYPFRPPKLMVVNPPFHCNIDNFGNVCMDMLKDAWSPAFIIEKILLSFVLLLQDQRCENANCAEAATLFEESPDRFRSEARQRALQSRASSEVRDLANEVIGQRSSDPVSAVW